MTCNETYSINIFSVFSKLLSIWIFLVDILRIEDYRIKMNFFFFIRFFPSNFFTFEYQSNFFSQASMKKIRWYRSMQIQFQTLEKKICRPATVRMIAVRTTTVCTTATHVCSETFFSKLEIQSKSFEKHL
jgi:hypothetical protein